MAKADNNSPPMPRPPPPPAPPPVQTFNVERSTLNVESSPPKPTDRMVRVKNVSRRAIVEGGKTYEPGAELDLTPERAAAYRQRVAIVNRKS